MNILQGLFGQKEEADFKELMKQGAVIVDVRSKAEFEDGHIQSAINVPLDTLAANLKKLGDKDSVVITCCASGGRSSMAKNILVALGYTDVHNGGGWHSLQAKLK